MRGAISRMQTRVPIRRLRNVSAVGTPYRVDNVFNWAIFDAYEITWFAAVPSVAGIFTLIGRTTAPADSANHDTTVSDQTGAATNLNGVYTQAQAVLSTGNIATAGYGCSGRVAIISAGGALASYHGSCAYEVTAGSAARGARFDGHIRDILGGFAFGFLGGGNIAIARLNVWGLLAGGA